MWIITKDGFYSVVDKRGEGTLTVRARAQADLDRLRQNHLPELGETVTGVGTDYPHRATVSRAHFAQALSRLAEDIDYPNFKNAVYSQRGPRRAHVLSDVWQTLLQLQREDH